MKKRVSKILWFGDALDENHQAIPPALSPSDEEHLQGLNLGEIYICVADADPALFIRTSAERIVYFKALDIEALSKFFIRKDRPDEAGFLIKFLGGLFSDYIQSMNFSSGALGEGFVIKVDSKTGDSYLEVDHMLARKSATFIELLIQRLRQVGGQIILSPASMSCSKVEEYDTFYRCYFENTDGEKTIVQEFVVGDQARSQTFNIKPGVHENVSNTYYWRLVTSIGDNYIDLSKSDCDTGSAAPQAGDDIVQLGNRTDKTRQNAIVLAAYGNDTPSFRQYAGIDSYSLAGKEVTAFSPNGNKVTGDFILKTGVNILTQFQILEDLIYSEISKVLDEIQAEDNYLYNSAFASNTNGWEAKNDIHFFTVNGKFLLVNGKFYSRKDAMAAIIRDEDRNVLRILSSGIKQSNADLANKPTYEEGEEPRKFFISFKYKVITAGTLTIGFPGQNLHFTEQLEPGEEYTMKEYSGTWDGTGDFELKFTGDIYIHSLALAENAFEDLYTKLSSEIKQTAESIRLEVKELSESNNQRFSQIEQRSDSIELSVSEIGDSVKELGIKIDGINDEISLFVKKDDIINSINVSDEGIVINANKINLEAYTPKNGVIAAINLGDEGIKINAEKIDISGAVTFDSLNSTLQNTINEKVSSSSLGGLAYEDAVEASQLGSTIIVGGYLNSNFIKVDTLEAGLTDGRGRVKIDYEGFRINTDSGAAIEMGTETVSNTYGGYIIIREFVRLTSPYCKLSADGLVFYNSDGSVDRYY